MIVTVAAGGHHTMAVEHCGWRAEELGEAADGEAEDERGGVRDFSA